MYGLLLVNLVLLIDCATDSLAVSIGFSYIFWLLTNGAYLSGKIEGAKYAMNHPPPFGSTFVRVVQDKEILWKSETFVFDPKGSYNEKGEPITFEAYSTHDNRAIKKEEAIGFYQEYKKFKNDGVDGIYKKLAKNYAIDERTAKRTIKTLRIMYENKPEDFI